MFLRKYHKNGNKVSINNILALNVNKIFYLDLTVVPISPFIDIIMSSTRNNIIYTRILKPLLSKNVNPGRNSEIKEHPTYRRYRRYHLQIPFPVSKSGSNSKLVANRKRNLLMQQSLKTISENSAFR